MRRRGRRLKVAKSKLFTAFGEIKNLRQWSKDDRCKINYSTLRSRALRITQKDFEKILVTQTIKKYKAFGEEKTLREWVNDSRCNINYDLLKNRILRKWEIERAILSSPIFETRFKIWNRDNSNYYEQTKIRNKKISSGKFIYFRTPDLTNQKFGLLKVIDFVKYEEGKYKKRAIWLCKCDCGNQKEFIGSFLTNNQSTSCGCKVKNRGRKSIRWRGHEEISLSTFNAIKRQALLRNRNGREIPFNITIEYIWDLFVKQNRKCKFSGKNISFDNEKRGEGTASLDRIDSSKGYIEGNVQWVHKLVNIMKQDMEDEEFRDWCEIISNYRNQVNIQYIAYQI